MSWGYSLQFDLFSLMQMRDATWTPRDVFDEVDDHIRIAEQAGFGTAWFGEHHFSNYSLCPSPLMAAAHFAGRTSRIRLGTGVVVLPLYEPIRLVQEIGMVDVLSGGRLVLGIGSGYQPYEFERFGVPLDETVMARTLEALDVIEQAMTQEAFSFNGAYYGYPETHVASKLPGGRMPDVWIAGMHPDLLARAAERGYGLMLTPSWKPTRDLQPVRDRLHDLHTEHGRDPADQSVGLMRFIHVTESRAEAVDAAERARYSSRASLSFRLGYGTLSGIFADDLPAEGEPDIEDMVENYIIGDVDHCIEKILEDHEAMGHSHVLCNVQLGGVPRERALRTMEALGADIIPGVRKAMRPDATDNNKADTVTLSTAGPV